MAVRRVAITWGALPVRTWEPSSPTETSRTQCRRFSIPECPWIQVARVAGGAAAWSAEVMT